MSRLLMTNPPRPVRHRRPATAITTATTARATASGRTMSAADRAAFARRMAVARAAKAAASTRTAGTARRNPLAYAIAGNPGRASTSAKESPVTKSRPKRRKGRKARRTTATARRAYQEAKAVPPATVRRRRRRTARAVVIAGRNLRALRVNPGRRRRRARRNPGLAAFRGEASGLFDDLKGLSTTLGELGDTTALLHVGAGAAGTALLGTVAARAARSLLPPGTSSVVDRMVNAAAFLGTAAVGTRLLGNADLRRRALAGGLAVALVELAVPDTCAGLIRQVPTVGPLIAGPAVARVPAKPPAPVALKGNDLAGLALDLEAAMAGAGDYAQAVPGVPDDLTAPVAGAVYG